MGDAAFSCRHRVAALGALKRSDGAARDSERRADRGSGSEAIVLERCQGR